MKGKNMFKVTHGDVLFVEIDKLPSGLTELKTNIVQHGELTGHAHRLHDGEFQLYIDKDGVKYLEVKKSTNISHEEHNTGTIPIGFYRGGITKEFDYETNELRNVMD